LVDNWLLTAKQSVRQVVVLHCEHSTFRAPRMAQYIRSRDRALNLKIRPRLTYPELYILHGGYSSFFSQYPEKCSPRQYVKMDDSKHHISFNIEKYRLERAKTSRLQRWTRTGQRCTLRPIPLQLKRISRGRRPSAHTL
jgi:M-phase inducer tyrosine phosphatase